MPKVRNLETLLDSLVEETDDEKVTVQELLAQVGRRAHGPVLLLLGFIAISPLTIIPGGTWLIALLTLIFAVQIAIGFKRPWLPKRILEVSFPARYLADGVEQARPWARRIDKFVKPRLTLLTDPPFLQLVALACVTAALVTFPLGFVPLAPILPGLAILFFGLGLTARDGILLITAFASLAGAGWLLFVTLPRVLNSLGL